MRKYIYTLILLSFTSLSYAQYDLDFPGTDDLPGSKSGKTICVDSGYTLVTRLIETSTGNDITPSDLEFEIFYDIGSCTAFPFTTFMASDGGFTFNIGDIESADCGTTNYYNIRNIEFQVRTKTYPSDHPYFQYSNRNKIFKLTLHRSQGLLRNGASNDTLDYVGCNVPRVFNLYNYGLIEGGKRYFLNGNEVSTSELLVQGETYQVYPVANAAPPIGTGLCSVPPLNIFVNSITINTNNYTGPEFTSPYPTESRSISICDIQDIVTITPQGSFPSNSNFRLWISGAGGTPINFVDSYTGNLSQLFNLDRGVGDRSIILTYLDENDPCHTERIYISLDITKEYNGFPASSNLCQIYPRSFFTTGNDLDYDSNTNEDELTYKSIYNLFLKAQVDIINNYNTTQPQELGNTGILAFPQLSYNMFIDDGVDGFLQIPISDFDNPVSELADLMSNCKETFYFDISLRGKRCKGPYLSTKIPFCITLYDVPTAFTNPDQYFCAEDNPTYSSLSIASSVLGNPLKLWGSEFGGNIIYDPNDQSSTDSPLTEGTYWVSEFDIASIRCGTANNDQIDSSQRFPVTVSIISGICSPETGECPCNSFELERGDKYIVSAWVKEDREKQVITYEDAKLDLTFLEGNQVKEAFSFSPSGEIIEGWQRVVGEFFVPITATKVRIDLNNTSPTVINPPGPVNLEPYFEDLPTAFPGVIRRYDVIDVGYEFTNCDGAPTTQIRIRSTEELLPNTIYKLSNSRGLPNNVPVDLLSPYIKVLNPTIAKFKGARIVEQVATVTCDVLANLFVITEPEPSERVDVFYDDIRIHPFNGNMKSFVYDPITQRLMAELDENNYATMYEYDEEGGLVRVKKETEKGVFTIQETRSKSATKE